MMEGSIHLADPPFFTLQGEGASMGRPAFFLRVSGCTVGCQYCDTKYSWSDDPKKGQFVSYLDIQKALDAVPANAIIVITGGEPFENVGEICSMLDAVDCGFHEIEVETSGYISDARLMSVVDRVTVSPKILPSAQVKEEKRMTAATAAHWLACDKWTGGITWKFVIRDDEDLDAFLMIQRDWHIPQSKIYLMPEAITAEQNLERSRWLAEKCKELGFNFSPRLHIWLWGPVRGK